MHHTRLFRARNLMAMAIGALALMAASAGSAMAILSSLGVAKRTVSGKPESIVVDRRGATIYELSGESLGHLRCVTRTCLSTWPAVIVRSASARPPTAPGVPGKLSVMRRVKGGFYQVMLDKHPLYYYSGDSTIGSTNGQGIKSFGGSWHVVVAAK